MQKLRPLFALFLRSLREDTRARLPAILRVTLILVILLLLWSSKRSFGYSQAPGRDFFFAVMLINLGFIAVAALSLFASAIAEEKEDETLTLLRMTNLSALAILFGKSTSRLAAALLLLAVQVPFTLLAITLGGISLEQVWGAYAILGATTFFLCNLALYASVRVRTTVRAGFLTGLLMGLLYAVTPFVGFVSGANVGGPGSFWDSDREFGDRVWGLLLEAHPMWALAKLLMMGGRGGAGFSIAHIVLNVGAGVGFFLLSWRSFDRYCASLVDVAPKPKKGRKDGKRRRLAWVTRTWEKLPLAWKDFHFTVGGRFGFYVRLALGAGMFVVAMGIVMNSRSWFWQGGSDEVAEMTLFFAGMCAAADLLLVAGKIFGLERQRQTLSSLVTLPWTTGKIIRQKLLGCLPVLVPWLIVAAGAIAISWDAVLREVTSEWNRFRWDKDQDDLAAMVYAAMQAALLFATTVWLSLRLRRGAVPAAIGVIAVWNILFGICMADIPNRTEFIGLAVGIVMSAIALLGVFRAVYRGIGRAAAEA